MRISVVSQARRILGWPRHGFRLPAPILKGHLTRGPCPTSARQCDHLPWQRCLEQMWLNTYTSSSSSSGMQIRRTKPGTITLYHTRLIVRLISRNSQQTNAMCHIADAEFSGSQSKATAALKAKSKASIATDLNSKKGHLQFAQPF